MSIAAPSIERFFANMAYWTRITPGSLSFQNACIIKVTGTKNDTRNQAPQCV